MHSLPRAPGKPPSEPAPTSEPGLAGRWSDLDRPPLRGEALTAALRRDGGMWRQVCVADQLPSTNAHLAAAARSGEGQGLVVVAESQTAGRGRLDRAWLSPPRAGLTYSVLLRPPCPPPVGGLGWLPLLAGLTVAAALRRLYGADAWLKWPNDVLLGPHRRKVAGVLAEVHAGAVVVGIGLNVTTRPDELAVPTATSLAIEGVVADRASLLCALLRELATGYTPWCAAGAGGTLLAAYRERCDTLGRRVRAQLPGGAAVAGEACRVDAEGRLAVRDGVGREHVLAAGDVVHLG